MVRSLTESQIFTKSSALRLGVLALLLLMQGCATVQYAALEKVGIHKRDLLVDRVEDARDAQDDTKEQFVTAYQQFKELVNFEGGALEAKYNKLNKAMERTRAQAQDLDAHIEEVDSVANDLFAEWEVELTEYSSENLRRSSASNLAIARQRYAVMIDRMRAARARVDPVLFVLEDHVLFLKHNLNAQALDSLKGEMISIDGRIDNLIVDMDKAIAEANAFIDQMETSQ